MRAEILRCLARGFPCVKRALLSSVPSDSDVDFARPVGGRLAFSICDVVLHKNRVRKEQGGQPLLRKFPRSRICPPPRVNILCPANVAKVGLHVELALAFI